MTTVGTVVFGDVNLWVEPEVTVVPKLGLESFHGWLAGQRGTPLVSQITFHFQAIFIAQKAVKHDELGHLSLG